MEIGIEFKEVADELGIENFKWTEGLNSMPLFIETLADLVVDKRKHSQNIPTTAELVDSASA